MSTAPSTHKLMTAEELVARSRELGRCELIQGEPRMMSPAGGRHGSLVNELAYHINAFVHEGARGRVYAAETGFILERDPDTVRAPDIAFIASPRVEQADTPQFIPIPPDLAVEVNSPGDAAGEVVAKVQWWLGHGVKLVWVVDPRSCTVTAYHPDGNARVYQQDQTLEGGDVLPGFKLPLEKLFTD